MTLGDIMVRYYQDVLSLTPSAKPEGYRIDALRRTGLAKLNVADVTQEALTEYCAARGKVVSAGTLHNELKTIRRALHYAMTALGLSLRKNAAMGVVLPARKAKRARVVLPEEIDSILKQLSRVPASRRIVEFALATGLGRAAILALEWGDVDLKEATLASSRLGRGAPAVVPLSEVALEILSHQPQGDGKCFGVPVENFRWHWKEALNGAGIPDIRFDDLRRSPHRKQSR